MNFIFEDGEIKNFGVKVEPNLSAYMQNAFHVKVVRIENDEPVEGFEFPLIIHRD